jgi:hypothetical protein
MARQFRKPETASRGGRGGARAAAQRENDAGNVSYPYLPSFSTVLAGTA